LDINEIGADLITVSSHKLGGPKGAGALIRGSLMPPVEPMIRGGGQERGTRAGTENVAAIAGFGAAAAAAMAGLAAEPAHMATLRDRLERGLQAISPEAIVFGREATRLPNTTLVAVPDMKAETAVIAFDLAGVAVSSGAACSSGKVTPSHVLAAMGVSPPLARGAVRVSLGPTTTESEIDRFLEAWRKLFQSLTVRRDIAA
jgi:cysteine desulfurase